MPIYLCFYESRHFLQSFILSTESLLESFKINHEIPSYFYRGPEYKSLRVFGCLCFPSSSHQRGTKFIKKTYPFVFIRHSPLHKAYRCYDPSTKRVYISWHVVFDESKFFYLPTSLEVTSPSLEPSKFPSFDEWFQKSTADDTISTSPTRSVINDTEVEPATLLPSQSTMLLPLSEVTPLQSTMLLLLTLTLFLQMLILSTTVVLLISVST